MYFYYGNLDCPDIHLDFSVLNSEYSSYRHELFKVLMMCPEIFFPKFMVSSNLNKKLSGDIMDYQEYLFGCSCLDFEMFNIPNYHFTKLLSKFVDPYAIMLKKNFWANHGSSGILSLNYFEPFCTSSLDFNRFNIHAGLFSSTRFYPLIKIWEPLHYYFEKNYIFGHHRSPTFLKPYLSISAAVV